MEAPNEEFLTGVLPLPSGSLSSEPQFGVVGRGGGAAVGGGGASVDGRRNGLLDANSGCAAASSFVILFEEPTGFRLIADGDGGCGAAAGEGPRGRRESGISRTGLLRGDLSPSPASSSSHQSLDSPLSIEERGVSCPEPPGRSAWGILVRECSR